MKSVGQKKKKKSFLGFFWLLSYHVFLSSFHSWFLDTWFPCWLSSTESTSQRRRRGFHPWVGKIPWRKKWQPTPVLLPGKSQGQRSRAGYSPRGHKESDTAEHTGVHAHMLNLQIKLRGTDILTILGLPIHKHGMLPPSTMKPEFLIQQSGDLRLCIFLPHAQGTPTLRTALLDPCPAWESEPF